MQQHVVCSVTMPFVSVKPTRRDGCVIVRAEPFRHTRRNAHARPLASVQVVRLKQCHAHTHTDRTVCFKNRRDIKRNHTTSLTSSLCSYPRGPAHTLAVVIWFLHFLSHSVPQPRVLHDVLRTGLTTSAKQISLDRNFVVRDTRFGTLYDQSLGY